MGRSLFESLESRRLLSFGWFGGFGAFHGVGDGKGFGGGFSEGFGGLFGGGGNLEGGKGVFGKIPSPPDATIQNDLDAVKTARTTLGNDWTTDGPTIQKDYQALSAAIKTARSSVSSTLTGQLTMDQGTLKTALQTLWMDFKGKADSTQITMDKGAVKTAQSTVQTDQSNIQDAINADPGVIAAKATLTSDMAPIKADETALQAALKQLAMDIKDNA